VPLSEQDLQKPTPQTVQRVFEAFVEIFIKSNSQNGNRGGSGEQSDMAALQALEYPEIHADAVQLLSFYKQVARLMWEVGIDDFGIKDMVKPEGPRLRLLLSAIINFAKFREEQLGVWEELMRRGEEAEQEWSRLSAREQDLRQRIDAIRQQRQSEEPMVLAVKEQIGQLVNELRELKKHQTVLSGEIEELKRRRQELTDNQARLQYLLSSGRQDVNKLKSRIVHSPEKLLQILSEMQASIASERSGMQSLERRSRELTNRVEMMSILEEQFKRSIQHLDHCDTMSKRCEDLVKQGNQLREQHLRQQSDLEELSVREQHLRRQLSLAQEKLARLTSQQEQKRQEFAERLAVLRRDYGQLSEERMALTAKMDDTDKLVKDMDQKVDDLVCILLTNTI
jgi:kinetochore protein Nuf2